MVGRATAGLNHGWRKVAFGKTYRGGDYIRLKKGGKLVVNVAESYFEGTALYKLKMTRCK